MPLLGDKLFLGNRSYGSAFAASLAYSSSLDDAISGARHHYGAADAVDAAAKDAAESAEAAVASSGALWVGSTQATSIPAEPHHLQNHSGPGSGPISSSSGGHAWTEAGEERSDGGTEEKDDDECSASRHPASGKKRPSGFLARFPLEPSIRMAAFGALLEVLRWFCQTHGIHGVPLAALLGLAF